MNGWMDGWAWNSALGTGSTSFNVLGVFLKNYLLNSKPVIISDLQYTWKTDSLGNDF